MRPALSARLASGLTLLVGGPVLIKLFGKYIIRSFDPATVAGALGVTSKELSNLLTRLELAHFAEGKQGRRRNIPVAIVAQLDIVVSLGRLGVPATTGSALAERLLSVAGTPAQVGPAITLGYDGPAHDTDLAGRLRAAAERVITRRRGRPPKSMVPP